MLGLRRSCGSIIEVADVMEADQPPPRRECLQKSLQHASEGMRRQVVKNLRRDNQIILLTGKAVRQDDFRQPNIAQVSRALLGFRNGRRGAVNREGLQAKGRQDLGGA